MSLRKKLIRLAYDNSELREDLLPLLKESSVFRIGPGGLRPLDDKMTLQKNTVYFLGASSSPDMVIVTDFNDRIIKYRRYPYEKDITITRDIGLDLLAQGSRTWLNRGSGKYHPELAKSLKSMLKGGPGKKVNLKDYERWTVLVQGKDPKKDYWRQAEWYGNVGGLNPYGIPLYEIHTDYKRLKELEKDSDFIILERKKGHVRVQPPKNIAQEYEDVFDEMRELEKKKKIRDWKPSLKEKYKEMWQKGTPSRGPRTKNLD